MVEGVSSRTDQLQMVDVAAGGDAAHVMYQKPVRDGTVLQLVRQSMSARVVPPPAIPEQSVPRLIDRPREDEVAIWVLSQLGLQALGDRGHMTHSSGAGSR